MMEPDDENAPFDAPVSFGFESDAEADATCLLITWFAVVESAALGVLPVLPALDLARERGDLRYLDSFFAHGLKHLRDEQAHANLWCEALLDFTRAYPDVVERARLPGWLMKSMLRRVAVPHDVLEFAVDCLAFEVVMSAFYEIAAPRLSYPPLGPVFRRLAIDERAHTAYDRAYLEGYLSRSSLPAHLRAISRYWWHTAGVLATVVPLLRALDRHRPLPRGAFRRRLAAHIQGSGMPGCRRIAPALLGQRAA
ncbi:hypothetical protein WMF20_28865 [Sorangium sp. So ce834]|uniref:hypothetical protein n=1 Tax=Sorangium sp. So ce834 TaxID=3133321 RepID=UPI003F5F1245